MNRNFLLVILLVASAGVAFYLWKTKKDPSSNMERTDTNFKIEDLNTIGRILITNKEGMRSDLKRVDDHWTINDKHRARQTNVDHLLKGINRQHLEHIPNKAATDNILSSMAVNGIHVEIFNKEGTELLDYYVGGVTQDERGTFFLKEGSDQPYSLFQPGFEGSLRVRYALRPVDWRDIRFWVEDNEKMDSLKVHYPKQRQHSFVIFKKGSDYDVKPLFKTTPIKENANKAKIRSYLTTLYKLACENFLNESPEKDSIVQMVPFMEMNMIYTDQTSQLRFFPQGPPVESEFSPDIERYFIEYSGRDFMIGQYEVLKGAFRSYDYFFEE